MNEDVNDSIELDEDKLLQMILSIYHMERENAKTDNKSAKKMREDIQDVIVRIAEGRVR